MRKKTVFLSILLSAWAWAGAASITVTSPRSGDDWCLGSSHAITWNRSGTMGGRVAIRLKNGSGFNRLLAGDAGNTGSWSWDVGSDIPPGDYFVHVRTLDGEVSGDSASFAVSVCIRPFRPGPRIPPPALPDFEIREVFYTFTGGEPKLAVLLKNHGALYRGSLYFAVRGGETAIRPLIEIPHGGFCAGGLQPFDLLPLDRGYLYRQDCGTEYAVEFDPTRRIPESDEGNNERSKLFPKIMTADGQITSVTIVKGARVIRVARGSIVTLRPDNTVSHDSGAVRVDFRVGLRNCGENRFQAARLLFNGGPAGEVSLFDGELSSLQERIVAGEAELVLSASEYSPRDVYFFLQGGYEETEALHENNHWRFRVRFEGF